MALLLKQLFGGGGAQSSGVQVPAPSVVPAADPDFADFATPVQPVPPSHAASSAFTGIPTAPSSPLSFLTGGFFAPPTGPTDRPFTKWYRVWERVTWRDFYQEMFIIPTLLFFLAIHVIGSSWNKSVAKKWAATYIPLLEAEYAQVGFKRPAPVDADEKDRTELAKNLAATDGRSTWSDDVWRQKKINEFHTYATGRQNAAFTDVKLTLHKRFNPLLWGLESVLAFLFDSISTPTEVMSATTYCFDGKEKTLVPTAKAAGNSSYDGFVWAVVHKDHMKTLRDDRYDLSLTATRDHPKLPNWATVMTESSEITDALLTPELLKAIESEGEALQALIITDMPIDAPKKLNDLQPRKRISLTTLLPSAKSPPTALFTYFLRLPDTLASMAHFRPEALRKIKATREEEARKIRKLDEEEKAEERKSASDRLKKEERDRKLKGMSAEEQRKFLERERGDERKKGQKRMTVKG